MQRQNKPNLKDTKSKKTLNNKTTKPNAYKAQQEFKKRYFEYYDDIKISDRQDW